MQSTEAALENPSSIITIPCWGYITVDQLDSPFEDDENDTVDPVFPCTLCGKTIALPSSLKSHERLRHGNKRQRRDPTPRPRPSTLQSEAYGPRKQRRDSSPQVGPSNPQSAASDPIRS
ncbi:hypothetical protein AVEN_36267-1 [Araneus ventricosus]|uniref:C2H2-type domain-containing protein n=1 Tax=Araneus ventricosus TaxID=182803 RepID=A0A4Y2JRA9_ARAVE|nr:hypothetical protein AVEN_36267-1 [Araneus ventricosus]